MTARCYLLLLLLIYLRTRPTVACVQSLGTVNRDAVRLNGWRHKDWVFLANFAATPPLFSVGFASFSFYLSLSRSLLYTVFTFFFYNNVSFHFALLRLCIFSEILTCLFLFFFASHFDHISFLGFEILFKRLLSAFWNFGKCFSSSDWGHTLYL